MATLVWLQIIISLQFFSLLLRRQTLQNIPIENRIGHRRGIFNLGNSIPPKPVGFRHSNKEFNAFSFPKSFASSFSLATCYIFLPRLLGKITKLNPPSGGCLLWDGVDSFQTDENILPRMQQMEVWSNLLHASRTFFNHQLF